MRSLRHRTMVYIGLNWSFRSRHGNDGAEGWQVNLAEIWGPCIDGPCSLPMCIILSCD